MNLQDQTLPPILAELNKLDFDYDDGEGMDFEPYSEFLDAEETTLWFQAWTGNELADGRCFRAFGQDGTGGYVAFWIAHPDKTLLDQPIVFLGSEGQTGVVASNLGSYLWLLASGVGPYEAVAYPISEGKLNETFLAFAEKHSPVARMDAKTILEQAKNNYPNFTGWIKSLCR